MAERFHALRLHVLGDAGDADGGDDGAASVWDGPGSAKHHAQAGVCIVRDMIQYSNNTNDAPAGAGSGLY